MCAPADLCECAGGCILWSSVSLISSLVGSSTSVLREEARCGVGPLISRRYGIHSHVPSIQGPTLWLFAIEEDRVMRLSSFLLQAEKENADPHPLEKSKKMATKAGKRTQP